MNLFEAGSLFGLPSDILGSLIKMLEDEKVPGTDTPETFLEKIAFASHGMKISDLK